MGSVQAVQSAYRNYANFNGRASRPEFWWFTLFLWLSLLLLAVPGIGSILWVILYIASILPALAVTSRRLHDTGRSGWWRLLHLLGLIGGIFLSIMCAQPGGPYNNQYGPGRLPPLRNTACLPARRTAIPMPLRRRADTELSGRFRPSQRRLPTPPRTRINHDSAPSAV